MRPSEVDSVDLLSEILDPNDNSNDCQFNQNDETLCQLIRDYASSHKIQQASCSTQSLFTFIQFLSRIDQLFSLLFQSRSNIHSNVLCLSENLFRFGSRLINLNMMFMKLQEFVTLSILRQNQTY